MDTIYEFLGIEVPRGAMAQSLELQFRGLLPTWAVIVLAVLICVGVAVLYATEAGRVSRWMRFLMACLRAAALVFLLGLVARPVLQAEFEAKRPREIMLLIDNSQSMKQQDRRLSRLDQLRVAIAQGKLAPSALAKKGELPPTPSEILKDPQRADLVREVLNNRDLRLLDDLQKNGPLVPLLVGSDIKSALAGTATKETTPKGAATGWTAENVLAKFDSAEGQTALADAISGLLQRKDGDLPAAIVVMSDGRDNASKYTLYEVAQECARLNVPLHIYGTGAGEAASLKLRDLFVQETLFAEDNVTIPVRWRADGIEKGTVAITLEIDGKDQTKFVPLQAGQDQVTEFTFTVPKVADKVKKTELSVSIHLQDDDTFKDEQKRPVQLVDGKVKVLYVEYAPRKEFHFLETAMLRDRRLDTRFWLITADPKAHDPKLSGGPFERAFPSKKELAKYDLIVLGDVPASEMKKTDREALAEYVSKNRGGLIVIAGRQHMPAEYVGMPDFTEMLPVEFTAQKFPVDGPGNPLAYQPKLTSAGLRTDWLVLKDLTEENVRQWKELPGLYWYYPVRRLRPGALPLLVHPVAKMGDEEMPLVVMHNYGKGQVVYVGFEETWRWRLNTQDKVFARYWGQLLLHMAMPHKLGGSATQVEFSVNRGALEVGKPATLFARLLDRNFEPLRQTQVEAWLEYLDAKPGQDSRFKLVFEQVPGREQDGEYRAVLPNHQSGRWQVQLNEPQFSLFPFTVFMPPQHEMEEAAMDAESLRAAAAASNGRFYQEETLHQLAPSIQARTTTYVLRQEVLLWGPMAFLIFTALVTCEWVLRKFANMS